MDSTKVSAGPIFVAIAILIALLIWKIIIFHHAARTANGWAVFFALFVPPLDAISLLFRKKCLSA